MGMVRMFHVSCDFVGPNCLYDVDSGEWYASQAESAAKEEGWIKRGTKWYCPECATLR